MFCSNKRVILLIGILMFTAMLRSFEHKALWVTPWDMTSEEKIDEVVTNAREWGITDLLVEVRYRGDALYIPNKKNKLFANPEPVSYILKNQDIDPLDLFISKAKMKNIKVHAWVTVLVVTPKTLNDICQSHIYFQNPDWMTYDSLEKRIQHSQFEGAYLDPGLSEVRDYLVNVFADIVANYNIDGLHLDYIRYPGTDYGYNPVSIKRYNDLTRIIGNLDFNEWKEKQISSLVSQINQKTKSIKPNLILSAAVISDIDQARGRYAQNWFDWLNQNIIDKVYLMAYQADDYAFNTVMNKIPERFNQKIVVGLRAWSDNNSYSVDNIKSKITAINRRSDNSSFKGISFFSYNGILQRNYQSAVMSFNIYDNTLNIKDSAVLDLDLQQPVIVNTYTVDNQLYLRLLNISEYKTGNWKLYNDSDKLIAEGNFNDRDLSFALPEFILGMEQLVLAYNLNDKDYRKTINLQELSMSVIDGGINEIRFITK